MSGESGVKYDVVAKDELDQGIEGYGAIQLNVTDTNTNPFTGTGTLHQNLTEKQGIQTNGNDYLKATESSFSQAVIQRPTKKVT